VPRAPANLQSLRDWFILLRVLASDFLVIVLSEAVLSETVLSETVLSETVLVLDGLPLALPLVYSLSL
jgi:hypothetical protein